MSVCVYPRGIQVCAQTLILNGERDKIMLGLSAKPGRGWELAHGKVKPGESLANAAERETFEEFGVRVKLLRRLETYELIYAKQTDGRQIGRHIISTPFAAELLPNQTANPDMREITDVRWFSIRQAERIIYKNNLPGLKMLAAWVAKMK